MEIAPPITAEINPCNEKVNRYPRIITTVVIPVIITAGIILPGLRWKIDKRLF